MPHETQLRQDTSQQLVGLDSTEPLALDLESEVTAEDLREEIFADYAHKRRTGDECVDLFHKHNLWPPKSEFWQIYFEGVRAARRKYGEQDTHRRVA